MDNKYYTAHRVCNLFCTAWLGLLSFAIVYFIIIGIGISSSYILNNGKYDMKKGTSLTPSDKSTISCYNDMNGSLFSSCIWHGSFVIFISITYELWVLCLCRAIKYIIGTKKSDEEISLIESDTYINVFINYSQIVSFILLSILLYPITCGLGLGATWFLFSEDYNMTNGWSY